MSKVRNIIRLYTEGVCKQSIGERTGLPRNSVKKYIRLFLASGKTPEEIEQLGDTALEQLFLQLLLIMDDFGLQGLDGSNRSILLEIIEDRHGNRSTIITSQLPVDQWYEIIGEQTIADAVLDRIVHDAHRIALVGESLRKLKNKIREEVETE